MTITQLEYLVAVDTHRHFGKAAEHCFVSQPTLSAQIQKLEEELGVKIFDRSKQPIMPTEPGEQLLEQARKILSECAMFTEMVDSKKNILTGELNWCDSYIGTLSFAIIHSVIRPQISIGKISYQRTHHRSPAHPPKRRKDRCRFADNPSQ